jgi:hypothetical protein
MVPLSEGHYKIRFTGTQALADLLKEAQDLMRHQVPNGDMAVIFERALAALVAERKKARYAQTDKPRAGTASSQASREQSKQNSRYIPADLRRKVFARDKGRCQFVSPDGTRCTARCKLEFHHMLPFARGYAFLNTATGVLLKPPLLPNSVIGKPIAWTNVSKTSLALPLLPLMWIPGWTNDPPPPPATMIG